jgi:hypothetical protein
MKRKLNTGINFSEMGSGICLKKIWHFAGKILQHQVH